MAVDENHRVSRSDRVGMWLFAAAGVAIGTVLSIRAITRIVEVLPNRDVTVTGEFAGTQAMAPIGPGGDPVGVELKYATVTAPSLPTASLAAIVIQQVIVIVGVITVVTCLVWLTRSIVRGEVFSALNSRLVGIATTAGFVTYVAIPFFGNMAANGAFARISDRDFDNVVASINVSGLVMAGFLAALISTVFAVGDRVRRDADGLI